jgi:hypothetical protein
VTASAYQKVLDKYTNIILIYSLLGIFLRPIVQDIFFRPERNVWVWLSFLLFIAFFLPSVYFMIQLIVPVKVAFGIRINPVSFWLSKNSMA